MIKTYNYILNTGPVKSDGVTRRVDYYYYTRIMMAAEKNDDDDDDIALCFIFRGRGERSNLGIGMRLGSEYRGCFAGDDD